MMGLEFALAARFRPLAAPFGQDALLQFHRQIGYVGLAFILIHFAISARWSALTLGNALAAPLLVWFGMAALLALIILIVISAWRRPLRLSYEVWHIMHTVLALVLVVGALLHVFFVDEYVGSLWKQILWGLMSGAFMGLLVWVRLVKPRTALTRPWRLERVVAERGETTTLALKPPPAAKFRFEPGQFAWFAIGRSPFSITQHPFSFASSAERDEVELAVKALGDFTYRAGELEPGNDRVCRWPARRLLDRSGRGPGVWIDRRRGGHRRPDQHAADDGRSPGRAPRAPCLRQPRVGWRGLSRRTRAAEGPAHPHRRARAGTATRTNGRVRPAT
jgi:predicted ferric reductase